MVKSHFLITYIRIFATHSQIPMCLFLAFPFSPLESQFLFMKIRKKKVLFSEIPTEFFHLLVVVSAVHLQICYFFPLVMPPVYHHVLVISPVISPSRHHFWLVNHHQNTSKYHCCSASHHQNTIFCCLKNA